MRSIFRIAREARRLIGISDEQTCKFYRIVHDHFSMHFPKREKGRRRELFDLNALVDQRREQRRILMAILGFSTGGGEIFPINLANALVERGYTVSVMVLTTVGENREISLPPEFEDRGLRT